MKRIEGILRWAMVGAFFGGALGECFNNIAMGDRIGGCVGFAFGMLEAFQTGRIAT